MKTFGEYLTEERLTKGDFIGDFIHEANKLDKSLRNAIKEKVLFRLMEIRQRPLRAEMSFSFPNFGVNEKNEKLAFVKNSLKVIELLGISKNTKPITTDESDKYIELVYYTKLGNRHINVKCGYTKATKSAHYDITFFAK